MNLQPSSGITQALINNCCVQDCRGRSHNRTRIGSPFGNMSRHTVHPFGQTKPTFHTSRRTGVVHSNPSWNSSLFMLTKLPPRERSEYNSSTPKIGAVTMQRGASYSTITYAIKSPHHHHHQGYPPHRSFHVAGPMQHGLRRLIDLSRITAPSRWLHSVTAQTGMTALPIISS